MAKKIAIPSEVEFDFIKSNFFRVIKADGAFGGVAPNGAIHMQIFSERQPIPHTTTRGVRRRGKQAQPCADERPQSR